MMFGIGTNRCRLHAENFTNMLGEDEHGWGLSHKGLLWHNGIGLHFTKRFTENVETKVGLLFDGIHGTLTYFKDGRSLGVAFRGLNEVTTIFYISTYCQLKIKQSSLFNMYDLLSFRFRFVNLCIQL